MASIIEKILQPLEQAVTDEVKVLLPQIEATIQTEVQALLPQIQAMIEAELAKALDKLVQTLITDMENGGTSGVSGYSGTT